MTITFGYEFEVAENGPAVLAILARKGAVPTSYLHEYHCGCSDCDPWDSDYLFSSQQDCTVSAEFPSKVLEWGSNRAEEAFRTMELATVLAGANLTGDSGMHVHVGKPDLPAEDLWAVNMRVHRLFVRYQDELRDIAAGHRDSVRSYNSPMTVRNESEFWSVNLDDPDERRQPYTYVGGSWLSDRCETWEFRLWNASKAAWRQRLCVGMSVAIVAAATDGVNVSRDDRRPVEEVLAPYLDAKTWAGILRQRYGKGGIGE